MGNMVLVELGLGLVCHRLDLVDICLDKGPRRDKDKDREGSSRWGRASGWVMRGREKGEGSMG